jgi:hypothetical protein
LNRPFAQVRRGTGVFPRKLVVGTEGKAVAGSGDSFESWPLLHQVSLIQLVKDGPQVGISDPSIEASKTEFFPLSKGHSSGILFP